jgi:transcription termination factor Rho
MSVLDRASLEQSPLADLHAIASELSIDGYRRLRKGELVDAILARQGGDEPGGEEGAGAGEEGAGEEGAGEEGGGEEGAGEEGGGEEQPTARRRRGRRGGRGRGARSAEVAEEEAAAPEAEEGPRGEGPEEIEERIERAPEEVVAGVVELLPGGSGFVRVDPPEPSDDDVYISAAQVKRCELVSGDRITGPRRPPRRSERFASLLRVDTINGRPASELADSARFDDLPAEFPSERFDLGDEDPTIRAISELVPIGRGSRVTIAGPWQSGKTETLRRLADALARNDDLNVWLVLAAVRPEEIPQWAAGRLEPAASTTLAASSDAQGQAVEGVIEQARRMAARGAHAVVLIDTLAGVAPHVARRALGAARKLVDGGSLTVIATAAVPLGGETTVIALDPRLAAAGRYPAIDLAASWTMRPELLVGESAAEALGRARAEALGA